MYIFKHGVPSFNRQARGYCIIYYARDKKYFCDNRYLFIVKSTGPRETKDLEDRELICLHFIADLIMMTPFTF